ncbi:hypothetical protein DFP72DRAFT_1068459 [Ephemerocybe angulata]|uniref:Uncharacterized protein n=1 Tax=Ephemerocybe angulata TaxID=980116 RepID=A0A8H6M6Z0_9AGAR|nr:hypothetical protein DFP72DRAFT_1068459 [Tulosesus angulatus]
MAPPGWASDAQTNFLTNLIPQYEKCQVNRHYLPFWTLLYSQYLDEYPLVEVLFPGLTVDQLDEEQMKIYTPALQKLQSRLREWFRWRCNARSRKVPIAVPAKVLKSIYAPRTRGPKAYEAFAKLYPDEVRAAKENLYNNATEEQLKAVDDFVEANSSDKRIEDESESKDPQRYINLLPAILKSVVEPPVRKAGLMALITLVGPVPESQGKISAWTLQFGDKEDTPLFSSSWVDHDRVFVEAVARFAKRHVFASEIGSEKSTESEGDLAKASSPKGTYTSFSSFDEIATPSAQPSTQTISGTGTTGTTSPSVSQEKPVSKQSPTAASPEQEGSDPNHNTDAGSTWGTPSRRGPPLRLATPDVGLRRAGPHYHFTTSPTGVSSWKDSLDFDFGRPSNGHRDLLNSPKSGYSAFLNDRNGHEEGYGPRFQKYPFVNTDTASRPSYRLAQSAGLASDIAGQNNDFTDSPFNRLDQSSLTPDFDFDMTDQTSSTSSLYNFDQISNSASRDSRFTDTSSRSNQTHPTSSTSSTWSDIAPSVSAGYRTWDSYALLGSRSGQSTFGLNPPPPPQHHAGLGGREGIGAPIQPATTQQSLTPPSTHGRTDTLPGSGTPHTTPPPPTQPNVPASTVPAPPPAQPNVVPASTVPPPASTVPAPRPAQPNVVPASTVPPRPLDQPKVPASTVPPRPLDQPKVPASTVPPPPLDPPKVPASTVPPRPLDQPKVPASTVPPRPLDPPKVPASTVPPPPLDPPKVPASTVPPPPHDQPNPSPAATAPRRSGRGQVPSRKHEVLQKIGTNTAKPSTISEKGSSSESLPPPDWYLTAFENLKNAGLGEEWCATVDKWGQLEQTLGYGRVAKGSLPVKQRPEEWSQWTSKGSHGARNHNHAPFIDDPADIGIAITKWWSSIQPAFRKSESELPKPVYDDPSITSDVWAPIRRSGANGLLSLMMLMMWWGCAAKDGPGPFREDSRGAWKGAVTDVSKTLDVLIYTAPYKGSKRGSEENEAPEEPPRKRART